MQPQTDENLVRNNFLIRGETNTLDENSLIKFSPSQKSRRNLTWAAEDIYDGVTVEEGKVIIEDYFDGNEISISATNDNGISTTLTLPVLDKIDVDVPLSWSYSKSGQFVDIAGDDVFTIVPNLPTDANFNGYIKANYTGSLAIKVSVFDANGNESDDLIVAKEGADTEGKPIFKVYANENKTNLNGNYKISLSIGYKDYDYSILCQEINVKVNEKINNLIVKTESIETSSQALSIPTQTIWTTYAGVGEEFEVQQLLLVHLMNTKLLLHLSIAQ